VESNKNTPSKLIGHSPGGVTPAGLLQNLGTLLQVVAVALEKARDYLKGTPAALGWVRPLLC
jgi:hypothetical protein